MKQSSRSSILPERAELLAVGSPQAIFPSSASSCITDRNRR